MEIVFHLQLGGLHSILQLLVLPMLVVHMSVECLEYSKNVEFCLVKLSNKEDEGDESSDILICG